ncbi:unnamed protein product [Polarella glacialis]|uniref:non-specific serine/threonine protein kinase n=1 Tax=Polarella glacialis TaxID=89957 RepID=A0A813IVI5_POLGL|nr:unnamed protein product [Polarella glacialis]
MANSPKPKRPLGQIQPLIPRRMSMGDRNPKETASMWGSPSTSSFSSAGLGQTSLCGRSLGSQKQLLTQEASQAAPSSAMPHEILARGERAKRKFREALAKGTQQPRTLKLMFVGRGRAGKTSTLKSLCNEAFDASEASTHGVTGGVCTATVRHFEVSATGAEGAQRGTAARSSGEWRKMGAMQKTDFVDAVLESAVARHMAAELRRPPTQGFEDGAEGGGSSAESAENVAEGAPERNTLDRPPGWASVIRTSGPDVSNKGSKSGMSASGRFSSASQSDLDGQLSEENSFAFKMPVDLVIKHMAELGSEDHITLQTFDFAGQEEYHTLHHLFMSNKGLYVVVFDLSLWLPTKSKAGGGRSEVRDRAAEEALTFWVCSVLCHAPESRLILVGTHVDLLGQQRAAVVREVDARIQQLLERNEALNGQLVVNTREELCFFPVDNRRKERQGIDALRAKVDETASEICTTGFLSKALPIYWLRFQTELMRLARIGPERFWAREASGEDALVAEGKPAHVLPYSQVARLARAVGILDDAELLSLLIYLHDIGCIIFFDEEELREYVVLDPHWLAEAAANILNCPRVVQGNVAAAKRLLERGELHVEFLNQHLWKTVRFAAHLDTLLQLLVRFDVLVASPDKPEVFVVPSMLPLKSGSYVPPDSCSLSFDFHGILTRLLPTVFPRLISSAAKSPSMRLTCSQVYKDSATIYIGRQRLAFELVPPSRPEMITVRPLSGGDDDEEDEKLDTPESPAQEQLTLELAKQIVDLVHSSTAEWLPNLSFTAGVLCPHCQHSGNPHVIDVAELSEQVVICSRKHEPVKLDRAGWAFRWRQEALGASALTDAASEPVSPLSPPLGRRSPASARSSSCRARPEAGSGSASLPALRGPHSARNNGASPRPSCLGPLPSCSSPAEQPGKPLASPEKPPASASLPGDRAAPLPGVSRREGRPPLLGGGEGPGAGALAAAAAAAAAAMGALPAPRPASPVSDQQSPMKKPESHESGPVGLVYFLYASPLSFEALDVRSELQLLQEALLAGRKGSKGSSAGTSRQLAFQVDVDVRLASSLNLMELLAHGDAAYPKAPVFLHFAMHAGVSSGGASGGCVSMEPFLLLEDEAGASQPLPRRQLMQWLRRGLDSEQKSLVSAVFLNCCYSEGVASAFMEAGVPHVICCRGKVFDGACKTFTRAFYRSLAAGRQVFAAFEYAKESVACAPQAGLRAESSKFLLLPRQEDLLKMPSLASSMSQHYMATLRQLSARKVDSQVANGEAPRLGNAANAMQWMAAVGGPDSAKNCLPPRNQHFLGRASEMVEMARHIARGGGSERGARVVNVWGKSQGIGKTAMLAEFTRFCICPGRLFAGAAIWVPLRSFSSAVEEGTPLPMGLERASSSTGNNGRGSLFLLQVFEAVIAFVEVFRNHHVPQEDSRQERLLWALRYLERDGNRVLLVLDGIEDWVGSTAVRSVIADMLQGTERLCLLFGSRIHVQTSFGGIKTDNLELKPLQPRDAAQLFLYRVHRHLFWKDLWRTKEEWMERAADWYGDAAYAKVADRKRLDLGEVPIALERGNREQVLDTLAAMPLLSEFCQGIPLRLRQTAERVTSSLGCLWDLLEELQEERDRGRQEIQRRILASPAAGSVCLRRSSSIRQRGSQWQLGKVLGQGAHGVVYHARDTISGESFAVKVTEDSPELLGELEMYQKLEHEHIVSYLGHEVQGRQLYIFLEYMPEGTLRDKIQEFGAFQESLCSALAEQILLGLEYLHEQQVLHRDLKCSNLLLDVSGRVKISDFGCSRWIEKGDQAKTLIGSPYWLPPELLVGDSYDQAADIWSFGCTVVELLTGKIPWSTQVTADNPLAAAHQIRMLTAQGQLPSAPDVSNLSEECRDFVWNSCLRVQPSERLSSKSLLQHAWLKQRPRNS